jgi:hypothetical protein
MNLVTPTRRANPCPAGGEGGRHSFTCETPMRAVGTTSMGFDLSIHTYVTERADDSWELWYNSSLQEEPNKGGIGI